MITGGPGSGKTTLLEALSHNGFAYVSETGRHIIKERKRQGLSARPDPGTFARQMFQMDYDNFMAHLSRDELYFFDRSFFDSAFLIQQTDKIHFEKIRDILITNRFNRKVFFIPPWKEIYKTDSERDQTFEESISIYEMLYDWYLLSGYIPIVIPRLSVEKRIEFILNEIN